MRIAVSIAYVVTALLACPGGASGLTPALRDNAWLPPKTTLDPQYVAAAVELLGNGLADPLGGRFCKMSHPGKWPDMPHVFTYGWLLPGNQKIVRIDGIEVKVSGSISPAVIEDVLPDLEDDALRGSSFDATPGVSALTPVLLLRMGKPRLAVRLANWMNKSSPGICSPVSLVSMLTMNLEELSVTSFAKGDFTFARECTDRLLAVCDFNDRMREKAGLYGWDMTGGRLPTYRLLRDDIQRRIDHPERPFDTRLLKRLSQHGRVLALTRALDQVGHNRPDGLDENLSKDPIVLSLVHERYAAVPSLIDSISTDRRMSQTISISSGSMGGGTFVYPVKEVAWSILKSIWPSASTLEMDNRDPQTGMALPSAKALRANWAEFHHPVD
jgi:hypothetical protein